MLIGLMRPVETQSFDVQGASLEEIHDNLMAHRPEGFDLISAPVVMAKRDTTINATGTFARRDQVTEIEADDLTALRAKVPEGWQLLSVREV